MNLLIEPFNLLRDKWLPFKLRDGTEKILTISAICREDVIDFALPRADFQGAAYQFAIGLLQTVFAPGDRYEWYEYYENAPTEDTLQQSLNKVIHAFNAEGDGALFMQDIDLLESGKITSVSGLLIEAPGENGIKLNTDHFIKRNINPTMSLDMAILALFTLQINAPAGGSGHRVGLRGGGPLTTLILPSTLESSLWQKLWFNVINREEWIYPDADFYDASVFPWLAATQTSEKKGSEIYASDVHPLHMFWAMPRRIRLHIESEHGCCDISGKLSETLVKKYRTQNYGNNYSGTWSHPLTAYRWNPKKPDEEHLSAKAQPGGITYKIWDYLTFTSDENGQKCARTIDHFYKVSDLFYEKTNQVLQLWVFGYDMDNMKARCWYSSDLPLYSIPSEQHDQLLREIKLIQDICANALWQCRSKIKSAWYDKPEDIKGDMSFIDTAFWHRTESLFFSTVAYLIENTKNQAYALTPEQANNWLKALRTICFDLFDEYALSELGAQKSIAKCMQARQHLTMWLYGGKEIKTFKFNHKIESIKEAV